MDGTSIVYSDRSCEGRKKAAVSRSRHQAKKFGSDLDAMHGPPDRQCHFKKSTITKRYTTNSPITYCVLLYKQPRVAHKHGHRFQVRLYSQLWRRKLCKYVSSGVIATSSALCGFANFFPNKRTVRPIPGKDLCESHVLPTCTLASSDNIHSQWP